MRITIHGHDLPGRRWDCQEGPVENVHVGLQVGSAPAELVPGDAPSATWQLDVRVLTGADGALDVRGPGVHGRPGERFVYLTWGAVDGEDGSFAMFRRAKLMWADIDADLLRSAEASGRGLRADVSLTDERGGPRCARVRPPAIRWSAR